MRAYTIRTVWNRSTKSTDYEVYLNGRHVVTRSTMREAKTIVESWQAQETDAWDLFAVMLKAGRKMA